MSSFTFSVWMFRIAFIGFFLAIFGSVNHNLYLFSTGVALEVIFILVAFFKLLRRDISWSNFFGKDERYTLKLKDDDE